MGYKGISKYIAVSLGMMLFLSGCQDAGTKADNESKPEESSEDVTDVEDFDAEEYFNSLLEKIKTIMKIRRNRQAIPAIRCSSRMLPQNRNRIRILIPV